MAAFVVCVVCGANIDYADDDPRWSVVTERRAKGEFVVERHLSLICPQCGNSESQVFREDLKDGEDVYEDVSHPALMGPDPNFVPDPNNPDSAPVEVELQAAWTERVLVKEAPILQHAPWRAFNLIIEPVSPAVLIDKYKVETFTVIPYG